VTFPRLTIDRHARAKARSKFVMTRKLFPNKKSPHRETQFIILLRREKERERKKRKEGVWYRD